MRKSAIVLAVLNVAAACSYAAVLHAQSQPQWTMAAPLPKAIGEIVGATVNGKIYVLSGLDNRPGVAAPTGYNWAYDPATNAWSDRKSMPVPAHHIMTATWADKIYVFGGFVRPPSAVAWQPVANAWVYDPATDSWQALAPMPTPRGAGQAVEVGGTIYVIGGVQSNKPGNPGAPIALGSNDQIVLGTVEAYNPATNTWQPRAPMPTARNHFFADAVNGKIYAIDGRIGTGFVTKSDVIDLVEEYDPATDHWSYAGRTPTPRGDVTGGEHNGRLYVAGGEFQDLERKMTFWAVEAFNPATGGWRRLPHMQIARHGFAAAVLGSQLHVMGGGFQSDGMPAVDPTTASHEVIELGD
ncbi:MAG TPA: kelch repeat-containing protein [Xanthobacteraceae bacterium]|jgi:N-acetylneuraminic acid mutarotase